MGLIDLTTPICVVHARPFQIYHICGQVIRACPACVEPRPPLRRRHRAWVRNESPASRVAIRQAKVDAAASAWRGKAVLRIDTYPRIKILRRHRADPIPGGRKTQTPPRRIRQQKWLTRPTWSSKIRSHEA